MPFSPLFRVAVLFIVLTELAGSIHLIPQPAPPATSLQSLAVTADTIPHPKTTPNTLRELWQKNNRPARVYVRLKDWTKRREILTAFGVKPDRILREYPRWQGLLLRATLHDVRERILPHADVSFVDLRETSPQPERAIEGFDLSANGLNRLHAAFPQLNGDNMAVSIKENAFDSTDIDLRGRYLPSPGRDPSIMTHSTNMATMAAGAGNSFYTGKGVAGAAAISSSSFRDIFPDPAAYFTGDGISVQNHSYGLGIENYYGAEAAAYDESIHADGEVVHVFSAGNQGDVVSGDGPYQDVPGFANLTGNFKMAKNVLTVGAVDTALRISPFSSRGPAYDGRVKPELVSFGADGTSGAAALTSGAVLLLQQAYRERYGELPPAGLLRAIVLNGADDLESPGPDYVSGYGNLNAWRAHRALVEDRFISGVVTGNDTAVFRLSVPEGATNLKVTLAWTDPAAATSATRALVNDLDLRLRSATGVAHLPWVLSTAPSADSLAAAARRGNDSLNNQEQVGIANPEPGLYFISVSTKELSGNAQDFYLAWQWDTAGFTWTFPLRDDPLVADEPRTIRWSTTEAGPGNLAYRLLPGGAWQTIASEQPLSNGLRTWTFPDVTTLAQLRMVTPEAIHFSDTFLISQLLDLDLELDCPEDFLLRWSVSERAERYRLYGLEDAEMRSLFTTGDTAVILDGSDYPQRHFAVAMDLPDGRESLRGPTLNLDFQRAGCYLDRLAGTAGEDRIELELRLGSLFELDAVIIEKREAGGFVPILTVDNPTAFTLAATDLAPGEGPNVYRARAIRRDGRVITGPEISVLFISTPYYVYPNPTTPALGAAILLNDIPLEGTFFWLYSATGRLIERFELLAIEEEIGVERLPPGLYFYRIRGEMGELASGTLVVQ